jgi:Domain of unknown function (DUF4351)
VELDLQCNIHIYRHLGVALVQFPFDEFSKNFLEALLKPIGDVQVAPTLRTGIVVVHQLPVNRDTLWLRLMGRDSIQAKAAQEITQLPLDAPYRGEALQLLANLKVQLEAKKKPTSKERQLIMNLSPLYLEQISQAEQRGEQRGEQSGEQRGQKIGRYTLVIRQLKRKLGGLSTDLEQQVDALSILQIENLGEALLDFSQEKDLVDWLESIE